MHEDYETTRYKLSAIDRIVYYGKNTKPFRFHQLTRAGSHQAEVERKWFKFLEEKRNAVFQYLCGDIPLSFDYIGCLSPPGHMRSPPGHMRPAKKLVSHSTMYNFNSICR